MKKLFSTVAVTMMLVAPPAHAETLTYHSEGLDLEIKKGAFSSDNQRAEQLLTIKNHSSVAVGSAWVECGFFHSDLLIARGNDWATDIQAGQDAYLDLRAYVLSADHTDCRFTSVRR
jgi:hypothetical protein